MPPDWVEVDELEDHEIVECPLKAGGWRTFPRDELIALDLTPHFPCYVFRVLRNGVYLTVMPSGMRSIGPG